MEGGDGRRHYIGEGKYMPDMPRNDSSVAVITGQPTVPYAPPESSCTVQPFNLRFWETRFDGLWCDEEKY